MVDHYLPGNSNITSYYGRFTNEVLPSQTNQTPNRIQIDDKDRDFSKVFTENIKIIQNRNSQRANSNFTNAVFYLIFISVLKSNKGFKVSPPHISQHAKVRQEINLSSQFLDSTRETLTVNDVSQLVKLIYKKS